MNGIPYSDADIAAIRARYSTKGPKQLAIELGRTPKSIVRKAQKMSLSCRRRNYRVEYSRAELKMIRKRYPNEGAAQLATDLGRTKAGIVQIAFRLGVKCQAYKRNEARWRDHHEAKASKTPVHTTQKPDIWIDEEHEQWMQHWRNRRAQRGHNAPMD